MLHSVLNKFPIYIYTNHMEAVIVPVNMDSLTIHVPASKTASQGIIQPSAGIIITSPGTR